MPSDPQGHLAEPSTPAKRKTRYNTQIWLLSLLVSLPGALIAELLLWFTDHSPELRWTLTIVIVLAWLIGGSLLQERVITPLKTLSNMVAGIREEDFSFRVRGGGSGEDALADLVHELNIMADRLQDQKISSMEATALLKKVLMEIDVAVFTFDQQQRLRIVNRAGEQLMGRIAPRLLGLTAEELELNWCLSVPGPQTIETTFPGKHGRWAVSHTSFRESGVPHQLLIVSDMSRALREEERQAWQRLIRVLGHELNNSLAPIKSIAGTLASIAGRAGLPDEVQQDMQQGLRVIENRVESLGRFMQVYTQLARMPAPSKSRVEIETVVQRASSLERRLVIGVRPGPAITVDADPDQLEQLLINLIRNAVDASLDASLAKPGSVEVGWKLNGHTVEIFVVDEGPGLPNSDNLFVPFFTTKHGGSGIGLILSRQIAEAHGGSVQLANRKDRTGCEATLTLPLSPMLFS